MSNGSAPRTNWLGHPLTDGGSSTANAPRPNPKKNPRNALHKRLGRFIQSNFWWVLVFALIALFATGAVVAYFVSNDLFNLFLLVGSSTIELVFRLIILIFLSVIQFVAIFWFMSRSKVEIIRPGDPKSLTLADYKGQRQLVKLVNEWISLLSDREQFKKMGGNYINGLLLYGPPGTGKTMLAKCMAGEAGIAFLSIEGSGFRAMFWGVDVLKMISFCSRAKRLAREYGACIAYIDEIDAVGFSRGNVMGGQGGFFGGLGGGSGSLTRLLYEMDGIGEQTRWEKLQAWIYTAIGKKPPARDWHVLYMGSTNRPDVLDPALTRPGRFDRSIEVTVPDKTGRREIVQYYLGKVAYDETVDVEAIVADTNGATPARMMSAITKDAVRIALFSGRNKIGQRDIDLAFQEQYFGIENPIEEMEEDQKRVLAYHEAGHAVVQHYVMPDQRIVRVSIIRRGGAYGYVLPVDTKEWHIIPLRRYIADIMVSFAGRASEKVFFGEYFNSVGGDFANIKRHLQLLISTGMFGPPPLSSGMSMLPGPDGGASTNNPQATEYWKLLESQTEKILREHAAEVHAVANALLERNDLTGKEAVEIIENARTEAVARGQRVPEGLPEMVMQLLPEHQGPPEPIVDLEPAPGLLSQPATGNESQRAELHNPDSAKHSRETNGPAKPASRKSSARRKAKPES